MLTARPNHYIFSLQSLQSYTPALVHLKARHSLLPAVLQHHLPQLEAPGVSLRPEGQQLQTFPG